MRTNAAPLHKAVIRYDTIEPRRELRAAVEAVKFIVYIDERVLQRIGRHLFVAANIEREAVHSVFIAMHKVAKCFLVACFRALYYRYFI